MSLKLFSVSFFARKWLSVTPSVESTLNPQHSIPNPQPVDAWVPPISNSAVGPPNEAAKAFWTHLDSDAELKSRCQVSFLSNKVFEFLIKAN